MFSLLRSRLCEQEFFQARIEREGVDRKCRVCGKLGCGKWLYWRKHDWMRLRVY